MENMTTVVGAALFDLNATIPAAVKIDSPTDGHTGSSVGVIILCILAVSVAVLVLLYCGLPVLGFVSSGIVLGSFAAGWMSSIGVVAAGSLFALLQAIAMGGVPVLTVLLFIVAGVAVLVGAYELATWLIHRIQHLWINSGGALHIDLPDFLHSASAWAHHLWQSIPAHHKWKILHT